jgi:peroxin-4
MASHSLVAAKRLRKELQVLNKQEPDHDICLRVVSTDNLLVWKAWIRGPVDTPYDGGVFELDIRCGSEYPLTPPAIKFITKVSTRINRVGFAYNGHSVTHCLQFHLQSYSFVHQIFHPNVHFRTGDICLDILKKEWSPAWGLQAACRAVLALLSDPDASSPLNCDAGNMIRGNDMLAYNSTAAMYTVENAHFCAWPERENGGERR